MGATVRQVQSEIRKRAKEMRRNLTPYEAIMWNQLRKIKTVSFRRQVPISPFIVDFAAISIKLIIEIDGASHVTKDAQEYDKDRTDYLENLGWEVLRVWNLDVKNNPSGVLAFIENRVKEKAACPIHHASRGPPSPQAGKD